MPAGPYLRDTNSGAWVLAGAVALNVNAVTTSLVWWDLSNPPGPGGSPSGVGPQIRGRGGAPVQTIVSVEGAFIGTYQVLISLADLQNYTPPPTPAGTPVAPATLPAPILMQGNAPYWTYIPAGARFIAFNCSQWTSGAMNCLLGGALIGAGGGV
jgi:hypothetical protein